MGNLSFSLSLEGFEEANDGPVSYTHLDVYKRQVVAVRASVQVAVEHHDMDAPILLGPKAAEQIRCV